MRLEEGTEPGEVTQHVDETGVSRMRGPAVQREEDKILRAVTGRRRGARRRTRRRSRIT
jgi:hypothetical protein